jgi:rhodanese-related sulfurtransferase
MSNISASNMHNGNWIFTRATGPEHPQGGTPCVIIGVRDYEAYEVVQLITPCVIIGVRDYVIIGVRDYEAYEVVQLITPCVIIGVRDYEAYEVVQLIDWLAERAAGYPKRDLPWHMIGCLHDGRPIPPPTIATRSG